MNNIKVLKYVDDKNYLSVSEAAKTLSVKETAIRNYLYGGKLTTYKFKGLTLLKKNEIKNWKERQRK